VFSDILTHLPSSIIMAFIIGVGVFYAVRQHVSDLDKRVCRLENNTVPVGECHQCKEKWEKVIESYHEEAKHDATRVRELSASEVNAVKEKLDMIMEIAKGNNEAVGVLSYNVTQILINLGLHPSRTKR